MTLPANPKGDLKIEGGRYYLRCPQCGHWGQIDESQLRGRVSVDHSGGIENNGCACGCTFHETRDWHMTADHWYTPRFKATTVFKGKST